MLNSIGTYIPSRDRPKSAPYLRLKNSKRTSICQSIGELGTLSWSKKILGKKVSQCRKKLKGWTLWVFNVHFVAKHRKIEGGPFRGKYFFRKKVSQCRKKTERGTLWSRPVWYVTRKNRKNFFGSVRLAK